MAPEDSAWHAMPHFSETGCKQMDIYTEDGESRMD